MKNQYRFLFVGLMVSLLSGSLTYANASNDLDSIVAIVNDDVITQSQLDQQINVVKQQSSAQQSIMPSEEKWRQQALQQLIDLKLQLQLAKNMNMTVDDATVNSAISDIAKSHNVTPQQLQAELQTEGVSDAEYHQNIRNEILVTRLQQKILGETIDIPESDVLNATKKIREKAAQAVEYHLQDALLPLTSESSSAVLQQKEQEAQNIILKLQKGEDIEQLAPDSDIGWRAITDLPVLFAEQVKKMKVGDVVGPIHAPNGVHVIKLVGIRGSAKKQYVTETHLRHILIKVDALTTMNAAKSRLMTIKFKLDHGEDFAKLAAANSQDINTAHKGGDLGWVNTEALGSIFAQAVDSLRVGQTSQPFSTPYGWHLAQVLGRRQVEATEKLLDQEAKRQVYQQKFEEAVQTWLQQMRAQAYIKLM